MLYHFASEHRLDELRRGLRWGNEVGVISSTLVAEHEPRFHVKHLRPGVS